MPARRNSIALCRIYTKEEPLQAALEAARMDEDEQVRRLVAEAVAFNEW